MKTKVIHYVSSWLPLTCAWLYNEVRFLPAEEIENYIVCNNTWNLDQFAFPDISSLETFPRWRQILQRIERTLKLVPPFKQHLPLLEQVCRAVRPDILHSHFGHMGAINAPFAKRYGIKHIVSFYGADVNYVPSTGHHWLGRYHQMGELADQVLCEGPFMAGSIAALGIPRKKIGIHRLGVDLERLRFEPRRYEKGEPLRFLIVASFREKKGIPVGLRALAQFRKSNVPFEVTIIGDAHLEHEIIEKKRIIQTIRETNLGTTVRLCGFQPYSAIINEAYRHHIFLAPSLTAQDGDCEGGAPVSIIEMAATGMPIVSTTHCDIPFVLSRYNAPFLVDEGNSEKLCDAIVRLVSADWSGLLRSNRTFIEQELDVRGQGEKLSQIYGKVRELNARDCSAAGYDPNQRAHRMTAEAQQRHVL